ncbi:MAG TPA: hypothetical protein VHM02_02675 [Thermoanaerobaculia bacterium]|nr:hypothetical protein [Thermoanaerobaculia bacterium]
MPRRRNVPILVLAALAAAPLADAAAAQDTAARTRVTVAAPVAVVPPPATAAASVAAERPFALLADRGDDTSWPLRPAAPGAVVAEATWTGGGRLVLTLDGPGDAGQVAHQSGESPLVLRFAITPALAQREGAWRLAVVNPGGAPVRGTVRATWPGEAAEPSASGGDDRPRRLRVAAGTALGRGTLAASTATPPDPPPETLSDPTSGGGGGEVRTILPDGRIQVEYPDGRVRTYNHGCGFVEVSPDGTSSGPACHEVQGAGFPPPPADDALRAFLEGHEQALLDQIRFLVDPDAAAVGNYLAFEQGEAATVVERIHLRLRYVDRLLGRGL